MPFFLFSNCAKLPSSSLFSLPLCSCTVVLFNAKRHTQAYLVNTSRKAFTSVAFSRCGRYVATGECGINPAIKVWELESPNGNLEQCSGGSVVAEFVDHKYAVTCVVSTQKEINVHEVITSYLSLLGILAHGQVPGIGGLAARHDCQCVRLACESENGLQQDKFEGVRRLFCRRWQLLCHCR